MLFLVNGLYLFALASFLAAGVGLVCCSGFVVVADVLVELSSCNVSLCWCYRVASGGR